nr:hypothetical protein [Clostridium psychrophilum]
MKEVITDVQSILCSIAPKYDKLNTILTLNIDLPLKIICFNASQSHLGYEIYLIKENTNS